MVSLKPRRELWYARVRWYDKGVRKETQVPLKTQSKVTARKRMSVVKQLETEVIELWYKGEKYSFAWMNEDGKTKVEYVTLNDAVEKWLNQRPSQGIAQTTINRNRQSMNLIMSRLGKSIRLTSVTTTMIDDTRKWMILKGYTPQGININLRTLTTFLNWAERRDLIQKKPYVDKIKVNDDDYRYFSDMDFAKILEQCSDWEKDLYIMYRNTGLRLGQAINGHIKGDILRIKAENNKTRKDQVRLIDANSVRVIYELQDRFESWKKRSKVGTSKAFGDTISRRFKSICKSLGLGHHRFHDLRHTFGVRRYLMTRDIYQVMKEMGHAKVSMTEKYADFEISELRHDFPTLLDLPKRSKIGNGDTILGDTRERQDANYNNIVSYG
jgi:integrase